MPALIFLSHSSKDDDTVTRIHDAIEKATGEDVWVDHKDIKAGDHWQESIDTALADCTHMLVMLSKDSVISREVTTEWRDALLRKRPLLPVVIDDLELTAIPARLRIIQPVNLKRDWDGGIKQLVAVIGRAHKGESIGTDFGQWRVTGTIDRMLVNIPISGREVEIAKVQDDLKRAPTSILGVGGLGKSRLAAEIVLTQGDTSGAVWHVCSDYSTAEDVYELLREHLGLEATTPTKEVLKRLRAERLLVVLDNAESISEGDPRRKDYLKLVNELADTKPTQVLLTSRTEWAEIKDMRALRLKEPQAEAAEQIVRDMAKAFDIIDYKPEDYAAELAEAARYHPRLIEIAVGKLVIDDPKVVIRELQQLKSEDIQEALDEMIQKTIEQMKSQDRDGEAAAQTLARWVVCRGGFTREAAGYLQQEEKLEVTAWGFVISEEPMALLDEDQLSRALKTLTRWQFVRKVVTEKGQTRYTIDPLVIAAVRADETAYPLHFEYYKALAQHHHYKQDYVGLAPESDNLEAAFEWAMSAGEYEKAYWFRNATSYFLTNRGRFEQRKNWLEQVAEKLQYSAAKELVGAVQNSLGILYQEHPLGDRRKNLKHAVEAYEAALVYYIPETEPLDYAMTQNNLGSAYWLLAQIEDREANLKRSVAAYEAALVYRTSEAAPLDYAGTQNNLGSTYRDLAQIEDRAGNLRRAVAAYEAALVYYTAEAAPLNYAGTQNNLGLAYCDLAQIEDREANLKRAVAAYEAALVYYTAEAAPLDYAMTQNNLGIVYSDLAAIEDQEVNRKRAVAAYEAALVYRTAEAVPLDYAMTQNNLGIAYRDLAKIEDQAGNLKRAVAVYEAALVYRTAEAAPLAYADTQRNLGIIYEDLGDLKQAIACWQEAEVYYRQMGVVDEADLMLEWIAWAEEDLEAGEERDS